MEAAAAGWSQRAVHQMQEKSDKEDGQANEADPLQQIGRLQTELE